MKTVVTASIDIGAYLYEQQSPYRRVHDLRVTKYDFDSDDTSNLKQEKSLVSFFCSIF